MCNVYEPATEDYLHAEWKQFEAVMRPYKERVGPRGDAPFVMPHGWRIGQWGMIRPGSPERIPIDQRGRPLMTNNARIESMAEKPTYRDAWKSGKRCLIPAWSYDEPYWGNNTKSTAWRFRRKDCDAWTLAGLWSEWTDRTTGEIVPNFTMLTMNCDAHPLLNKFHKPDPKLPPDQQDKRSVISIERADWDLWLNGSIDDAKSLIQMPALELFAHGAADPTKQVELI